MQEPGAAWRDGRLPCSVVHSEHSEHSEQSEKMLCFVASDDCISHFRSSYDLPLH